MNKCCSVTLSVSWKFYLTFLDTNNIWKSTDITSMSISYVRHQWTRPTNLMYLWFMWKNNIMLVYKHILEYTTNISTHHILISSIPQPCRIPKLPKPTTKIPTSRPIHWSKLRAGQLPPPFPPKENGGAGETHRPRKMAFLGWSLAKGCCRKSGLTAAFNKNEGLVMETCGTCFFFN